MGTSLFGLKPKNTYQALLKTTANTAIDATLRTISDGLGNDTPLQLSLRRVGVLTDTSVVTQVSSVIQATTLNSSLVIAPNGTGALVAAIPDGTATGGNARGQYAVDLQLIRSTASTVASGNNSFAAGLYNTVSNTGSCAVGYQNTVTGTYGIALGNSNNVTSNAALGISNISTNGIAIGNSNRATGQYSTALGFDNTVSGYGAFSSGETNTSTGLYSHVLGLISNASGNFSSAFGRSSNAYLQGQLVNASGFFASQGDAQQSLLIARRSASLGSAATTVLSLDGTGVTNLIIPLGTNRLWAAKITATAFVSVAGGTLVLGDSYMGEYTLLFKKVGGVSSVVGVTAGNIIYDANMVTSTFTFAAGASQDLQITFTAPTTASATTFRCVARVELTEVAY